MATIRGSGSEWGRGDWRIRAMRGRSNLQIMGKYCNANDYIIFFRSKRDRSRNKIPAQCEWYGDRAAVLQGSYEHRNAHRKPVDERWDTISNPDLLWRNGLRLAGSGV